MNSIHDLWAPLPRKSIERLVVVLCRGGRRVGEEAQQSILVVGIGVAVGILCIPFGCFLKREAELRSQGKQAACNVGQEQKQQEGSQANPFPLWKLLSKQDRRTRPELLTTSIFTSSFQGELLWQARRKKKGEQKQPFLAFESNFAASLDSGSSRRWCEEDQHWTPPIFGLFCHRSYHTTIEPTVPLSS